MNLDLQPGSLISARGREWVVLPGSAGDILHLRPLGAGDEETTRLYVPLERAPLHPARFPPPEPSQAGSQAAGLLLRDALRLAFRAGAGPFRAFGNLAFAPRAYQLVPLLMALKLDWVRLLIADDVGVGKTIEAGLVVRELWDRGEISRFTVLCPPHLCDQWREELERKFNLTAEIVTSGTAARLERGLPAGTSLFDTFPVTVVSLDYVKQDRRRDEFLRACPELVIVDEAHTCVQASATTRHQRYQVLAGLAAHPERHLILLTATPHSGDEEAFYNLLGLLDGQFRHLRELHGKEHDQQRERLARHFVQRRRADIAEWQDSSVFPDRLSREAPYQLGGDWGRLFNDVLDYAQRLVAASAGESLLRQRMSWWAALALLRCISSSPAAAAAALRTRIRNLGAGSESAQLAELEIAGAETVFDGDLDGDLSGDDSQPGALLGEEEEAAHPDAPALQGFIQRAEALRGPAQDGKLKMLLRQIDDLLQAGHNPVVFCRYIPTAHYVGEHLSRHLGAGGPAVAVITGEFVPAEREQRVTALGEAERLVLVATDCLSEGINLQALFDAVVHYDLSWNPTRHEQREGRVDRFGQPAKVVRAVMLYGENNPVDGAVLQVILRKAERIRKELGVSVPLPDNNGKVMQAVMEAVLLKRGGARAFGQTDLFGYPEIEAEVSQAWESARDKAAQSRTLFAQRRLKPAEVLPEWDKAMAALGSQMDVELFVRRAAERLNAALEPARGGFKLPLRHLPPVLRERLEGVGIGGEGLRLEFQRPADPRHIHRSHPLVAVLAGYLAERALDGASPELVARCGALFTRDVRTRTLVALLRLRTQLTVSYRGQQRLSLAEEALVVALRPGAAAEVLGDTDAAALMAATPAQNMAPERRDRLIAAALEELPHFQPALTALAQSRANQLLEDHRLVREAAEARHLRYAVSPCLPVDLIGLYVLMPAASL